MRRSALIGGGLAIATATTVGGFAIGATTSQRVEGTMSGTFTGTVDGVPQTGTFNGNVSGEWTPAPAETSTPTPTGTATSGTGCVQGWDGTATPPTGTLAQFPFADTVGLCDSEMRTGLRKISGDYTAKAGETINRVEITGDLNASAGGVKVLASYVHGEVNGGGGTPAVIIYSDVSNRIKGSVKVYRSNVWGGSDVAQSNSATIWEWRENFLHGRGGGSAHNDTNQVNGPAKVVYDHNTFFAWEGGSLEKRDDGPNWTGTSALNVTGSGGEPATSNIMWGDAASGASGTGTKNLFRGNAYCHVNVQAGTLTLNGNTFYQNESANKRSMCGKATDPNAVIIK